MISHAMILLTAAILLIIYIITKTHIINNLIIIEFASVLLIVLILKILNIIVIEIHLRFYFIVLIITERIAGLSILITTIRTHGNDFLKSSIVLKF